MAWPSTPLLDCMPYLVQSFCDPAILTKSANQWERVYEIQSIKGTLSTLRLPEPCIYWCKHCTMNLHSLLDITAQVTGVDRGGVCENAEVVGRTVFVGGDAEVAFRPFQDSL